MNKLVLLDAGGVILDGHATRNVIRGVARVTGASTHEIQAWYTTEINPVVSTGQESEEWLWDQLQARYGELPVAELARIARWSPEPLFGAERALRRLSARGATIWVCSNYIDAWLQATLVDHGLRKYIGHTIVSSAVGLRKPDTKIYQLALDQRGGDPADIVFVDDKLANLNAAASLGFATVHSNLNVAEWEQAVHRFLD